MIRYSIVHPSRGRPRQAFNTMVKWVTNCNSSLQYILSLDKDDRTRDIYYTFFLKIPTHIEVKIIENDNKNLVQAIQKAIPLIDGDCVISLSDDFDCPMGWDKELEKVIGDKTDYAIRVQDGLVKSDNPIMTIPILSKTVLDRLGYIYYPEYTGMFADNDLFEVCQHLGVLKHSLLTFEHKHYLNKKAQFDETYKRHNTKESYEFGEKLLKQRRLNNFGC